MRIFSAMIGLLFALSVSQSHAALIRTVEASMQFIGAKPPASSEPLRLGVESGTKIAFLDLGSYESADIGNTFTFTPTSESGAQWEAVRAAMQTEPTNARLWLSFDVGNWLSFPGISTIQLNRGLVQVDVTVLGFRTGVDDGNTFRTAEYHVKFYSVIPEPATFMLIANAAASSLAFRRRRRHCP